MKKFIFALKNLGSLLGQDFINSIHFSGKASEKAEVESLSQVLRKEGIVRIPGFLSADMCDTIREKIEELVAPLDEPTELSNGTFVNIRGSGNESASDSGMIDIFHVDRAIPEVNQIEVDLIQKILESTSGQKVVKIRNNAYLNQGIANTRSFHVDALQPVIYKAFIYLVDVPDLSYGPYALIKGSHRFSGYVYLNLLRNIFIRKNHITDMPLYNRNKIDHCIGKKGDLILSNQSAIHRGMPQEPQKKRVALVLNYMVVSRLSYLHESAKKELREAEKASQALVS